MSAEQKLYAFWRYDRYPFVLGGPIMKIGDGGEVYPEGYEGCRFKPIKILPLDAGVRLHQQIRALADRYNVELEKMQASWRKRVEDLLPEIGDKR